ncbi:hypothetical protein [Brevibacillus daliensis]|uniref:hypothetical protein n=1 Tax=Brevibacillus daliensis TaxID=2892995 RepID=UPI001E3D516E|nr:hypothetical protein [Brevibacillus daliensis]
MKKPFIIPTDRPVLQKVINKKSVKLPNNYQINVSRERISHCGRSIFREFDETQIVLEIVDPYHKVTKRLPIPASFAKDVAELINTKK